MNWALVHILEIVFAYFFFAQFFEKEYLHLTQEDRCYSHLFFRIWCCRTWKRAQKNRVNLWLRIHGHYRHMRLYPWGYFLSLQRVERECRERLSCSWRVITDFIPLIIPFVMIWARSRGFWINTRHAWPFTFMVKVSAWPCSVTSSHDWGG